MLNFFNPLELLPQQSEQPQEAITLGPYNYQQAPYLECQSCGTPITVGQELVPIGPTCKLAWAWQLGPDGLRLVPTVDVQEQAWVHADCSAEFCRTTSPRSQGLKTTPSTCARTAMRS